jgi:putative transposase
MKMVNTYGQSAKSGLNKSILDVCWSKFIDILSYKAEWNDKQIIKVDRFFPSSKTCSKCGWINNSFSLKDREWICSQCGTKHDRDVNAATNILNEGYRLKITSVGTTDHGRGGEVRPDFRQVTVESSKVQENVS